MENPPIPDSGNPGLLQRFLGFITSPNYSRTLSLLVLLIIIIAIPLTILLSQQEQDIRQSADTANCSQYTTQAICTSAAPDSCYWNGTECKPKIESAEDGEGGCCNNSDRGTYGCHAGETCSDQNGSCKSGFSCTPQTGGSPTPTPGGGGGGTPKCTLTADCPDLTCKFNSTFTLDDVPQENYFVTLYPNIIDDPGIATGWRPKSDEPILHTYLGGQGTYTAEASVGVGTEGNVTWKYSCRTQARPFTPAGGNCTTPTGGLKDRDRGAGCTCSKNSHCTSLVCDANGDGIVDDGFGVCTDPGSSCTGESGRADGCACVRDAQCAGGNCWSVTKTCISGPEPTPGSKTCTISGATDNLDPGGSMNLRVTYNNSWSDNDDMHNAVQWYEVDPETGEKRAIIQGNDNCQPNNEALGRFSKQCESVRGQSDECGDDNHPCVPSNVNVKWTANKEGTTIIQAHPYLWYSGGDCGSCEGQARSSHAYCSTVVARVGDAATPTPSPTRIPTTTPILTPTPTPGGGSPTPTPTLTPGGVRFAFNLILQGLGLTSTGDNNSPRHAQRNLEVKLFSTSNTEVTTKTGSINFSQSTGRLTGIVDMGVLASGSYTIKVKSNQYLRKLIPGIQNITSGSTYNVPSATLIVGDINNDNKLDITDYNQFLTCYNKTPVTSACEAADLNDNGTVDGIDYNYFVRSLSVEEGD